MRLLFDDMLKRLASWCRILGMDSEFLPNKGDSFLLAHAEKNGLVLITRDLPLTLRCEKRGVKFIKIKSDIIEEQIAQIIRETGVEVSFPAKTRCAACNGELDVVPKEGVAESVPPNVLANHEQFWKCKKCGKVFWEGGHWNNIRRIYEQAKALI